MLMGVFLLPGLSEGRDACSLVTRAITGGRRPGSFEDRLCWPTGAGDWIEGGKGGGGGQSRPLFPPGGGRLADD